MEEHHSVTSLMIVVLASFFVPIVLHRLKLKWIPVVVAEIILGMVLGKSGFQLIQEDKLLELLSMLGIIYLMFLSGLEIDFDLIQKSRKQSDKNGNPLIISVLSYLGILLISLALSWIISLLGYTKDIFFMTLIISTISVSITLPVLKDKGLLQVPIGQSILLTAVIADFCTMLLLAVYVSLRRSEEGAFNTLWLLLLFVAFFVVYRLIRLFRARRITDNIRRETISIGTRGVFALILFFVAVSEGVGAENILGAFLAGVILSLMSPEKAFVQQLNAFGYGFLIPIFFVMVGAELDLVALIQDRQAMVMLPLLLLAFYVSRLMVVPIFKRWFSWKQSIASGLLLSCTLSLVIAAAKVGLEMGIIDHTMNTALVLAAVTGTLLSPVLFQRMIPDQEEERSAKVSLVGINAVTLALAQDLAQGQYEVTLYGSDKSNLEIMNHRPFTIQQLPEVDREHLEAHGVFDSDIVVLFTADDRKNFQLAKEADQRGVERIIARVENKREVNLPEGTRIQLISTFFANKTLLRSLIEYPSLVRLASEKEAYLREVPLYNHRFHSRRIRDLPFPGDTLVIRVYRNGEVIFPQGDTEVQVGDRLIITGTPSHVRRVKRLLS
ncbi:MAG: monovalent cation:proton antiporter family protein [Planifilum sp.]|jgi:CPA2 family monovalent cation:H+ antiporter-2